MAKGEHPAVKSGDLLWQPTEEVVSRARMTHFKRWVEVRTNRRFSDYEDFWSWSIDNIADFWRSLWDYFEIEASRPPDSTVSGDSMPGTHWFDGARLSYAEHIFRHATAERPAMIYSSERLGPRELTWDELRAETAKVASYLKEAGVGPGDRVASFMPNIPQTLVAFLATASVGAVWSSCSPDFGVRSVIDRFRQIEPKVLFAVDGYSYGGRSFDRAGIVDEIRRALPTLAAVVVVSYRDHDSAISGVVGAVGWDELMARDATELEFAHSPFEHPLWIVYTSGTTGAPKAIVHGQGGILLEHLKMNALHFDIGVGDRVFWYSSTGWIMWNIVVGALLTGATIVVHDGSAAHPDLEVLWRIAAETRVTFFGTSPAHVVANMKAGTRPGENFDLDSVRTVGSTGSPLSPEGFVWLYEQFGDGLWLTSVTGGTDVAAGFIGGSPTLPVRAGELQCRCLGAAVDAFDPEGNSLIDEVGELVITKPMPTMPLYLWGDPDGERYMSSYFDMYPGVWRHGDWIRLTTGGSAVILGRSDSTINRRGVRIGTSELYSAVEELPGIADSICVDVGEDATSSRLVLLIVPSEGAGFDADAEAMLRSHLRNTLSPRHVPDVIYDVPEIPRTLNGKKLEVPLKRIFEGAPLDEALNVDSMANPDSINPILELAAAGIGGTP